MCENASSFQPDPPSSGESATEEKDLQDVTPVFNQAEADLAAQARGILIEQLG